MDLCAIYCAGKAVYMFKTMEGFSSFLLCVKTLILFVFQKCTASILLILYIVVLIREELNNVPLFVFLQVSYRFVEEAEYRLPCNAKSSCMFSHINFCFHLHCFVDLFKITLLKILALTLSLLYCWY